MISFPAHLPEPELPLIAPHPAIPKNYWELLNQGQWPQRFWLPTDEPTSDGMTGVAIHAFARLSDTAIATTLPDYLIPFAHDGHQYFCFDLSTETPAIRYVDTEVDQWLVVAPDFDHFITQLTTAPIQVSEQDSYQKWAHMALLANAEELPAVLAVGRESLIMSDYLAWLIYFTGESPAKQQVALDAYAFVRDFMGSHLTIGQAQQVDAAFRHSAVSLQFHTLAEKW
ncbi:SMI1/KNR4 family protein [Lacticaseibacillus saniviri]|uniref:Knr4/Smi1-like domain-containing protein n=1 Tax=Lacticaseibacillus saniviri JCM 17471 = DSM 24301 TaxID=1293598 RepID=A0A0R2MZS4_9LACO|nr:SMI1/KNR4 family protein [Lacticaseibacillus saniviri]KRO17261.1 hypothetical protein IV56_GL000381 [Lacticaseibacillus saniviri JCM 17471 = DSM 24301]MCG4282444.1 SMI1/KNR4 family protein [Lacticaseibacillus saniviri]